MEAIWNGALFSSATIRLLMFDLEESVRFPRFRGRLVSSAKMRRSGV